MITVPDRRLAVLLRKALVYCPRLLAAAGPGDVATRLGGAAPALAADERLVAVYAPAEGPRLVLTTARVYAESPSGWPAVAYGEVAEVNVAQGSRRATSKAPSPDGLLLRLREGEEVIIPVTGRGPSQLADGSHIEAVDAYTLFLFVRGAATAAALRAREQAE
jgi:hypothetical protein